MQIVPHRIRTVVWTVMALTAFAANSVLCRMALGNGKMDAAGFTTVRLISGTAMLLLISTAAGAGKAPHRHGSWISAAMLFLYAAAFSFAYLSLSAGTGALILFGAVQTTMIISALTLGERPHLLEWVGLVLALFGLTYLMFPGLTAPSPTGSALMAAAGVAWAVYTLRGRRTTAPLVATTRNFLRTLPFALVLGLFMASRIHLSVSGLMLATASGALASGVGYVLWYAALGNLTATLAATVQLSVPLLAALGGVVFISEEISLRLMAAAAMILGGVGLAIAGHNRQRRSTTGPSP